MTRSLRPNPPPPRAIYRGIQPIDKVCCKIVSQFAISTKIDKHVVELFVKVRFFKALSFFMKEFKQQHKKKNFVI